MIDRLVRILGLEPHPEGGWFRETWRARRTVATPRGVRAAATAIIYLLGPGQVSRRHRLRAAETWALIDGPGLDLRLIGETGDAVVHRLDATRTTGVVVPPQVWMDAVPVPGGWALTSCTCLPGFDFSDLTYTDA